MPKLCFAILAHNKPECLQDLIDNINLSSPGSRIVVFNGSQDLHWHEGVCVEICPYSIPLKHDYMVEFQCRTMQWLYEIHAAYDFLITIDSDMMLIKPGFGEYLERTMRDSEYMGVNFQAIDPYSEWDIGRRFHYKWNGKWRRLLETDQPFGALNGGQIFRREYVEKILQWKQLPAIRMHAARSRLKALEEIIYPTAAVRLDCRPMANPGAAAIQMRRHSELELISYNRSPDMFLVHRVGMSLDSPDRRLIRLLSAGTPISEIPLPAEVYQPKDIGTPQQSELAQRSRRILADMYFRFAPEVLFSRLFR